jgi:hypothetical protein
MLQGLLTPANLEAQPESEGQEQGRDEKMQPRSEQSPSSSSSAPGGAGVGASSLTPEEVKAQALGWDLPEWQIDNALAKYNPQTAYNLLFNGAQQKRKTQGLPLLAQVG